MKDEENKGNLVEIMSNAFTTASSLQGDLVIPSTIIKIGYSPFSGTNLQAIPSGSPIKYTYGAK
jgi:hypothetical protein